MVMIGKANLPAPTTNVECDKFKYGCKVEKKMTYADAKRRTASLPDLHAKNSYFTYFKNHAGPDPSNEHQFTYDQIKDSTASHARVPRDTCHPKHTEASRRKCIVTLATSWQVRSSQAYGWLPPIDTPNYGFGRSSIFTADSMDQSHLAVGGNARSSPIPPG